MLTLLSKMLSNTSLILCVFYFLPPLQEGK